MNERMHNAWQLFVAENAELFMVAKSPKDVWTLVRLAFETGWRWRKLAEYQSRLGIVQELKEKSRAIR